jgi:hypothetical protein
VCNIVDKLSKKQKTELQQQIFHIKTGNNDNLGVILESLMKVSDNMEFTEKVVTLALNLSIQDKEVKNGLIESEVLSFVDSAPEYCLTKLLVLYGVKLTEIRSAVLC